MENNITDMISDAQELAQKIASALKKFDSQESAEYQALSSAIVNLLECANDLLAANVSLYC